MRRLSYADLGERALGVAEALGKRGALAGMRVALALRTSPEFYHAFFGALLAGVVPVVLPSPPQLGVPLDFSCRAAEMLRQARVFALVTQARLLEKMAPIAGAAGDVPLVAAESLLGRARDAVRAAPADVALIQFSSGSGGAPKAVTLTHAQILANVDAILEAIACGGGIETVGVSWLPLHHDMGLVGCLLAAVRAPGDLFLLQPETFVAQPALWLRTISERRAAVSPAPSFAYALAAERIAESELEGVDLSCWRHALNGGEPVSAVALSRFIRRFGPFGFRAEALRPVYGLAEATLAVCFPPANRKPIVRRFCARALAGNLAVHDEAGIALVSVGRPLPGYDVRIADDDGRPLAEGLIGRVLVRGPSLMAGYFDDPAGTAAVLHDGWLDTGDQGFSCDGEIYIHGRSKDIVIVHGLKHAPERIEAAAEEAIGRPGCCAAVAVSSRDGDHEALGVLVERARSVAEDDRRLAEAIRRSVGDAVSVAPAVVVVVPHGALPRTTSGKIRRGEARRLLATGALAGPEWCASFRW